MDLDDFLSRPSLAGYPLSLVLRLEPTDDAETALKGAQALLQGRHPLDEILIPRDAFPLTAPRPDSSPRIKAIPSSLGTSRGLELALRLCRWPIVLTYSPAVRLTKEKLAEMLTYLDQCDLVAGKRRGATTWWSYLPERPFRWLLGVPVADPFCPVKLLRRPAVANIVLQSNESFVDFELIAKLTYLTSLMDECDVEAVVPPRSTLTEILIQFSSLTGLFFGPKFWDPGARAEELRPPLNRESSLPALPALPVSQSHPQKRWIRSVASKWGPPATVLSRPSPAWQNRLPQRGVKR